MLRVALLFVATCLLPLTRADVSFTKPAAGEIIASTTLHAAWAESGQRPSISTFSSYSLFLCAGGNNDTDFINLFNLQPYATYGEGDEWKGAISTGWGGNSTDAYFLLMVSTSACGGSIKNYSNRFTISSMTGSFPPNVVQGIDSIGSDTNGPNTDQSDAGPALACTSSVAAEPAATTSASGIVTISSSQASTSSTSTNKPSSSFLPSSKPILLSAGALAGIIATAIVIFTSVCGIAIFVFLRLRRRRMQPQSPKSSFKLWSSRNKKMERLNSNDQPAELSETAVCKEMEADKRQPTELSAMSRVELPARRSIYELPAS